MEALWTSIPTYVTEKLEHRAIRVSSFLTSRSISNGLYGLGKCRVQWKHMPIETRIAFEEAIVRQAQLRESTTSIMPINTSSPKYCSNSLDSMHNDITKLSSMQSTYSKKGTLEMNALEVSQLVYGLGLMEALWNDLEGETRDTIIGHIIRTEPRMSLQGRFCCLIGLSEMNAPMLKIPPVLIAKVLNDVTSLSTIVLHDDDTLAFQPQRIPNVLDKLQVRGQIRDADITHPVQRFSCALRAVNKLGVSISQPQKRQILEYIDKLFSSLAINAQDAEEAEDSENESFVSQPCTVATCFDIVISLSKMDFKWGDLSEISRLGLIHRLQEGTGTLSSTQKQMFADILVKMDIKSINH